MQRLLAAFLQNSSITLLDLGMVSIDRSGLDVLAEVLRANRSLKTILLPGCSIDDEGADMLAEALLFNVTLREMALRDGLPLGEPTRNRIHVDRIRAIESLLSDDARKLRKSWWLQSAIAQLA